MLDKESIRIIDEELKKGRDVEIQRRKDGIVVLSAKKTVCRKQEQAPKNNKK